MLDCYLLYSELSPVETQRLEALGALIPKNNIDKSLNSFIYIPHKTQIPSHILSSSHYEYLGVVTEQEANKHCAKCVEISNIKPKDIVIYDYYRKLPMEVISIDDNGMAKLRIRLRHYETSVEVSTDELKLLTNHLEQDAESVEYSAIPSYIFENQLSGYAVIDCDTFFNVSDRYSEYVSVLTLALRIKTLYGDMKLVLANPIDTIKEFAEDFGLICAYGNLRNILSELEKETIDTSMKVLLYTESNFLKIQHTTIPLEIVENTLMEVDYKEKIKEQYGVSITRDLTYDEVKAISCYIEYYAQISNQLFPPQKPASYIEKINRAIGEPLNIKQVAHRDGVTFVDYKDNYKVATIKTYKKLEKLGLTYLCQNIEFYSRILKS